MILRLAIASLLNRRLTAGLTVLSIALSVALLLAVERVREQARTSFADTVSGTDLIVGARTSPVHLLLFSVFRIGNPTNTMRWESHEWLMRRPEVAWTIPLSLGDSHRGYRVIGTSSSYFQRYRYASGRSLVFAQGGAFTQAQDAVLGAEVARRLGYSVGSKVVLAHGAGDVSFALHDERPFRISGVLAPTGTPVDRAVHVPLGGLDALHASALGTDDDDPLAAALRSREAQATGSTAPASLSAVLVGLHKRGQALGLQRAVNEFDGEALTAILPGATLMEVWEIAGVAERALSAVSWMVVAVGLAGMLVALLTGLAERRREMAVLRSVGARPSHVFALMLCEAAMLTAAGIVAGAGTLQVLVASGRDWLERQLGLTVSAGWFSGHEIQLMLLVSAAGTIIGLVPAWRIYRQSLADGMIVRL